MCLQLFIFWSRPVSRWQRLLIDTSKHTNSSASVRFTDIELNFCVVVAESPSQDILRVRTCQAKSLLITLALNIGVNPVCLLA